MVAVRPRSTYISRNMKTTVKVQDIFTFLSMKIKPDFVDVPEEHDFWEIVYLESGEAVAMADDNPIHMFPGDVVFHKPGEAHYVYSKNNTTAKFFFMSFHSASKAMSIFEGLKVSLDSEQKKLIYKMYDEARNIFVSNTTRFDADAFIARELLAEPPLGAQQLFKLYLETFLLTVGRVAEKNKEVITYETKEELELLIFRKMVEQISDAVYSNLTIDDLCKSLNYSRTYLSVLFKKRSGVSVMQYYNSLKIKEAKRLIKECKHSVFAISEILKFNNQYYFSRVFKKIEGVSPTEYKNKVNK